MLGLETCVLSKQKIGSKTNVLKGIPQISLEQEWSARMQEWQEWNPCGTLKKK